MRSLNRNSVSVRLPFQSAGGRFRFCDGTMVVLLAVFVVVALACGGAGKRGTDPLEKLRQELVKEIEASGGEVGLALKDLGSGETLFLDERQMMHAASTMKVPVMIEVFRQAEAGRFRLDDSLQVKNEFRSIVDGSPYSMDLSEDSDESIYSHIGEKMSIGDLTYRMITESSDLAANLLIDLVGAEKVTETMRGLGAADIQVLRGVEDLKAYRQGLNNRTNAYDLLVILEAIALHRVAGPASCEEMIAILAEQKFRGCIPRDLPEGVRVANKTGSITAVDHDMAIVYPPGRDPYILVVLTRGIEDPEKARDLIARLSRRVYEEVVGESVSD